MTLKSIKNIHRPEGFTLIEVLLSVVFLGLLSIGVATVYSSGLQSLEEQADRMLLDGQLRSRMELLVATDFSDLNGASEVVTVRGTAYTIAWTVAPVDLDGDATPEAAAKQVTVSVSGVSNRSLTTILVNNQGGIGRL